MKTFLLILFGVLSLPLFAQKFSAEELFTKLKFKEFQTNNLFLQKAGWNYVRLENAGTSEERNFWDYYQNDKIISRVAVYKNREGVAYYFVSSDWGNDILLELMSKSKPYHTAASDGQAIYMFSYRDKQIMLTLTLDGDFKDKYMNNSLLIM